MFRTINPVFALLCLVLVSACTSDSVEEVGAVNGVETTSAPDQILSNGKILTVDEDFSIVEAIAIDGDRILATGSNEEILALAGAGTEVVDLEGRTVVPGLIDNHVHFIRTVQRWHQQARIDGVESREEALSIVADHAARPSTGRVVYGAGRLVRRPIF